MGDVHYAPARSPFAAYGLLVARVAFVVVFTAFLSWTLPPTARRSCPAYVTCDFSGMYWGVDMIDSALVGAVPAFFASRLTSPLVFGPVVIAGIVALVLEYRSGRFDFVLERRG